MSKKITQDIDPKSKESKLFSAFKNVRPNTHLLHLSVLRQLNNKRAGTASTKTKGEVRGGGKKPWKQKGTGRARAGSNRSPLWVGGGIIFGPKPRTYETKLPQKERNLAILQALISQEENIVSLEKLPELTKIKTKEFLESLKKLNLNQRPLLIVCDNGEKYFEEVKKSANNLQDVVIKDYKFVGVHEILKAGKIAITKKSLNELEKRFSKFVGKKNTKVA